MKKNVRFTKENLKNLSRTNTNDIESFITKDEMIF